MIDSVNINVKKKLAKASKQFNKNVWFYNEHFGSTNDAGYIASRSNVANYSFANIR